MAISFAFLAMLLLTPMEAIRIRESTDFGMRDPMDELKLEIEAYDTEHSALKREVAVISMGSLADKQLLLERMHLIKLYGRHFGKVFLIDPLRYEGDKRLAVFEKEDNVFTWRCGGDLLYVHPYKCMADLLNEGAEKGMWQDIDGMAFFHFDFWMHPAHMAAMVKSNKNMFGAAFAGFDAHAQSGIRSFGGYECADTVESFYDRDWVQSKDEQGFFNRQRLERVLQVFREQPLLGDNSAKLCLGWSDLYRIPESSFKRYAELVERVGESEFHEVVVPTIINHMSTESQSSLTNLHCWGNAHGTTNEPEMIGSLPCGHAMNLAEKPVRDALEHILATER